MMNRTEGHVTLVEILLVEDNPGDQRLTREALREGKIRNNLTIIEDGESAIEYLCNNPASLPDLILLDLNLPRKDGREVLQVIKNNDNLMRIPVVILTTSQAEEDIIRAYNLRANCYITKPIDFDQFIKVIKAIEEFWFTIVKLP